MANTNTELRVYTLQGYNLARILIFSSLLLTLQVSAEKYAEVTPIPSKQEEEKRYVDIPSQPLAQALILFSLRFKRIIVARPKMVEALMSSPLKGRYSADTALERILKETNLEATVIDETGFTINEKKMPSDKKLRTSISTQNNAKLEELISYGLHLQSRPENITATAHTLDNTYLASHKIDSISRLSIRIPNMSVTPDFNTASRATIRGIENYTLSYEKTAMTPLHVDNRYISEFESATLNLFDMENLQVYLGPQSAEAGRSSVAGSIYVSSAKPKLDESSYQLNTAVGNYALKRIEAAVNTPIYSKVALRLATRLETRAGYTRNWRDYGRLSTQEYVPILIGSSFEGRESSGSFKSNGSREQHDDSDKLAFRASLRVMPSPRTDLLYQWEKKINQSNPAAYIDPYLASFQSGTPSTYAPPRQLVFSLDFEF